MEYVYHFIGAMMKVAIPIWDNRVSPVFDTAGQALLVDIIDGSETARQIIHLPAADPTRGGQLLAQSGVDVLICGAISRPLETMLLSLGIDVIPWIKGEADPVIRAFAAGKLINKNFSLPGCRPARRRCRSGGRGHRLGRGPQFKGR